MYTPVKDVYPKAPPFYLIKTEEYENLPPNVNTTVALEY